MHKNVKLVLTGIAIVLINNIYAQNKPEINDSAYNYLINKCYVLFEPHSDLTYSFGTEELIDKVPDLNVNIPTLKDSTKFLDELKGEYKDWSVFYKIGKLYQQFNQGQQAMNYYNQAYNLIYNEIMKDTLKAGPYTDMGSLYLNLNNKENAFYFYQKAYALNDKDSIASLFLPMFYIFNGDFKRAEEIIGKNLNTNPEQPDMYIWLATSKIYQAITKMDKNNLDIANKSIDELFDLAEINQAAKKFKNDIRFPLLEQMIRQLAILAKYSVISDNFKNNKLQENDLKDLKQIQKSLEKILDKNQFKNKYIIYKSLGFNYLLQKNLDKGIEYFRKAITVWPPDKRSKDYTLLFTANYFLKNDTLAALKVIDEKIRNDSAFMIDYTEDYNLKGNIYIQKHNFESASNTFQNSLNLKPNPNAYLGLAFLEINDKKLKEANQLINQAYELNKEYYLSYAVFGVITLMNNQTEDAKNVLEKALQLNPEEKTIKEIYSTFFPK